MNQVRVLTEDDLKTLAPSIFARNPISDVSNRYQFVPTFEVVKRLQNEGWQPTACKNPVQGIRKIKVIKNISSDFRDGT